MRCTRLNALTLLGVCSLWIMAYAGTPGSFRGTVVEGDQGSASGSWLYVRGRDGGIRRVDISQAAFAYDESVPPERRKPSAREQLEVGAEVRITAEQGNNGEWHASRVELVKPPPSRRSAEKLGSS